MADVLITQLRITIFVHACAALFSAWLACEVREARAQDAESEYGARAEVAAEIAKTNPEDATASGTRYDVRARGDAHESIADVLADAPGARVQSTGGVGAKSHVSLRGAGTEHTTVLLGDLPLNTADTGAFDLSLLPLAALDTIDVYRGGAPVWWSDGAIGGLVRLSPRTAEHSYLRAELGLGSFGQRELSTSSGVAKSYGARPSFFSHVALSHADNDYAYVDDGQTRFDESDDVTRHQRNAERTAGDALAHFGVDLAGGRLDAVINGHARSEGIPGPLATPTLHTHRQLLRMLAALGFTKEHRRKDGERGYRLQGLASVNVQNNRFSDPYGELGHSVPVATDDLWARGYGRLATSFALTAFLEPTLVASLARDEYRPEDALAFSMPPRPSGRTTEALAVEARLHGKLGDTRLELRPSLRGQWSQTSIWTYREAFGLPGERSERDDTLATYRVAAAVAPFRALAFSASASSGARLPSMLELFGDRVFIQESAELRPERSRSYDVGVVVSGDAGELCGQVEARGFLLSIDDLVVYRQTSQFMFKAENVASARVLGLELGAQAAYGRHFALAGSLTAQSTRNQFDKALPLRPPLTFNLRPELAVHPGFVERASIYADVEHVSFVYLDSANLSMLEGRTIFSLGAAVRFLSRMTLSARAQNLFDVQATDVLSRPLARFGFFVSLAAEEALD